MNQITEYHSKLEWSTLDQLSIGEAYALAVDSPLTFLLVGINPGRTGRREYDVSTLVGPSGRSSTRTYWGQRQEVLVIPPAEIGPRVASAASAFSERRRLGLDRVVLDSTVFPYSLAPDDIEDVIDDDSEVIVYADEQEV